MPAHSSAGRSSSGVKLPINLDADDKVAAAVVIPPDDKPATENGVLLQ